MDGDPTIGSHARAPRARFVVAGVIAVATLLLIRIGWSSVSDDAALSIRMLDVGQGDAILITAPTGERILIDGGPDATVLSELQDAMGFFDRRIDLVVMTHSDLDHSGGLVAVLERYDVEHILTTGTISATPQARAFAVIAEERRIPVTIARRPMRVAVGDDLTFTVLWPLQSLAGKTVDKPNDFSIVLLMEYAGTQALFTGDIEGTTEGLLIAEDRNALDVDVFKVPHHGSNTSSTLPFLEAITPSVALISVGEKNSYGHPSPRVVKRIERTGATVYRTDRDGAVELVYREGVWERK